MGYWGVYDMGNRIYKTFIQRVVFTGDTGYKGIWIVVCRMLISVGIGHRFAATALIDTCNVMIPEVQYQCLLAILFVLVYIPSSTGKWGIWGIFSVGARST